MYLWKAPATGHDDASNGLLMIQELERLKGAKRWNQEDHRQNREADTP